MKKVPGWLKAVLIIIAVYLFAFQPIPFYLEVPGSAFGLDEMVEVDGEYSKEAGDFYITTVGVQQATPMAALSAVLPYRDLYNEQELFGNVENFEEYDEIQQYYMNSSENTAIQVAFDAAGLDYELSYNGVYVLEVLDESTFSDDLQVGDTVKAVDGQAFQSSQEFIDYVSNLTVGETIEIEYERDGEMHTASGELIQLESGAPGIGIGLVDNTSMQTDPPVDIHSGGIGGPSAGLMFSLQIYNRLQSVNIHGDHNIAGTGTIAADGTVGRIGGIEKKVVTADEEGADYFLAPDDELPEEILNIDPNARSNYEAAAETAEAIDSDMEIIPIKTFSEAVAFLEELAQEENTSAAAKMPASAWVLGVA